MLSHSPPNQRTGRPADIISIQSQVIYGSVGNSIALPALEKHGFQTLAVPTVLLSNTPDYPSCYGGEISDEWFCGFLQGINDRAQDSQLRAVITGYLGSAAKAERVCAWLRQIAAKNPGALVVVDPVMGDDDTGYYVDQGLGHWYRHHLLPLATGLTPNLFELSCLTAKTLICEQDIINAARSLLSARTQWIVVTSATRSESDQRMKVICVTASSVHSVNHEAHKNAPKGTGDLFTAELTAGLLCGLPLEQAVENACETTRRCVLNSLIDGSGVLDVRTLDSGVIK